VPRAAPPVVDEALRAPGQPLDAETRALMEPRFGHNFSQVRVRVEADPMSAVPRLFRGAIVALEAGSSPRRVIVFQYNPDTLTRTLTARTGGGQGQDGRGEALRLTGPPEESIKLDVELDAADQPEIFSQATPGVAPALAALEVLLYPASAGVINNEQRMSSGDLEIIPPEAPLTIFVWGPDRVLPVRLSGLSITEESFDARLNPIRARLGLELRVLSYYDLGLKSTGGALFMAYHKAREALASAGRGAALGYALQI
jgi:hypothetical protein